MTAFINLSSATFLLFLILLPNYVNAAKPWGSTLSHLSKTVNTTAVVQIEESAKITKGYIKVKVIETILGQTAPTEIFNLRIKDDKFRGFKKGERKLVTFSYLRKHPTLRDEYIEDPKGPRIVDIRGVTTLAAFNYSDDLKSLFELQNKIYNLDFDSDSKKYKFLKKNAELLEKQILISDDVRTQRLLTPEILLREDLHPIFSKKQTRKFLKALAKSERGYEIDSLFFEAMTKMKNVNRKNLSKLAMKKLDLSDAKVNLASFEPIFIVTALKATAMSSKEENVNKLSKFIGSNSPAIVKQAIRTMNSISPKATHKTLSHVEISDEAHRDIKQAIADYLGK